MKSRAPRAVPTYGGTATALLPGHSLASNPRFELFDSLRAIAVLAVLFHHLAFYTGGHFNAWYGAFTARLGVGVTLFFLISGFLLYRPYAVAMLGGQPALGAGVYARRRALRILPAYWLALTALALWPGLEGVLTSDWWVFYGLLQTYRGRWVLQGLHPTWSLCIEAAFYVTLPLFAFLLARVGRGASLRARLRLQLLTLATLGLFGIAFRGFVFQAGLVELWTTLPSFLLWFAVGMLVAVVSAWRAGRELEWWPTRWLARHSGWCWVLAIALLVGISVADVLPRPFSRDPYTLASYLAEHVLYALIALLVMLPAVFGQREGGVARAILRTDILTWLGSISYGVFLWHDPLLAELHRRGWSAVLPHMPLFSLTLLGVPIVIACAWASWRLVEQPALRLK